MSNHTKSVEVTPESIWNCIVDRLERELPRQTFLTWFKPLEAVSFDGRRLTLRVPSRFYYDWIEGHYSQNVRDAADETVGGHIDIAYVVEPNRRSPVSLEESTAAPIINKKSSRKDYTDSRLNPRYTFDSFVEGDCNRFARAAALAIAESPGMTPYNPLLIYGGAGLGKTHLIQAIGNLVTEKSSNSRVLYVTSEQFTSDFVEAIRSGRSESFSRLYRTVDVLLLDDVHFFMAKNKTQEEFFHTFNALHHTGKQLVFSSDCPPRELDGFDKRLVSRLQWGLVAELLTPDFETRLAILERLSEMERVALPGEVAQLIATHIKDNVRTLRSALIHILAQSSLLNRKISVELARKAIKGLVKNPLQGVSIERIQEITAEELGITGDLIRSKTRKKAVSEARQIAIYLCTEMTKSTLKAIGLQFGGRNHATVIHSRNLVKEKMKKDGKFAETIEDLKRRIEITSI